MILSYAGEKCILSAGNSQLDLAIRRRPMATSAPECDE